ncbi:DUF4928 domain-containing protein [Lysobacteraceae bacterium NML91-0213]|nr:DUF4928 domain-containing protein [Xanthomonadaceae bacterium NML91-0213]
MDQKIEGNKGALAAIVAINEQLKTLGRPFKSSELVTGKKGQVKGLGKSATQVILKRHDIDRVLAEEGGRTSRGTMDNMLVYLETLNKLESNGVVVDLERCEQYWIEKIIEYFESKPFVLKMDPSWSVRTAVAKLVEQAKARQREATGAQFMGTMMQHLVGAKLELVMGPGEVDHHCANTNDQRADRHGDFDLGDVAIHVSTAPTEALIRKCGQNLSKGIRPVIITTERGVGTADGLLENQSIADRVDVIDFEQFIATNVFEHGRFTTDGRKNAFAKIVDRYNVIVGIVETDPGLRIAVDAD